MRIAKRWLERMSGRSAKDDGAFRRNTTKHLAGNEGIFWDYARTRYGFSVRYYLDL